MRIKICGITQPEQGQEIAKLGATALGFICVRQSPRFVTPEQIRTIIQHVSLHPEIDRIGVFANADLEDIVQTVNISGLNGVQLHGDELPEFCDRLRVLLPQVEIIKALRIRSLDTLNQAADYREHVDAVLLDAYHPTKLGGTGTTLNWQNLREFKPKQPWFLSGGLAPDNILDALETVQPHGIDLSSSVERSPGDKDLAKVAALFQQLQRWK